MHSASSEGAVKTFNRTEHYLLSGCGSSSIWQVKLGMAWEAFEMLHNEHLTCVYPNCCTAAGSPQVIWHLNVPSCVLSPWAAWCLLTCGILWAESVNWSYASRFVCIYSNSSHSSLGEPSKWCRHTLVKPKHQSKKCDKVLENECSGVNEFRFTTFNNFDYVLEYSKEHWSIRKWTDSMRKSYYKFPRTKCQQWFLEH